MTHQTTIIGKDQLVDEPESKPQQRSSGAWFAFLVVLGLLSAAVAWAYWPTFVNMSVRWSEDPQYSHGFLVPLFSLIILWSRREFAPKSLRNTNWWGLGLLAVGCLCRFVSAYLYLEPLDGFSLLPMLMGLCLLLGGMASLRWAWPAVAFLGFMLPLPYRLEMALSQPLRRLATNASTFALQTLGYPAIAEGNIIVVNDVRLGVIDACSGLGMLFTFFALATAVALLIDRPIADRIAIIFSAIPIALVVNIIRITSTGIAHISLGHDIGHALMHDLAGWLMMPVALFLLWLELLFLKRLFISVDTSQPIPMDLSDVAPTMSYPKKQSQPLPIFDPPPPQTNSPKQKPITQ